MIFKKILLEKNTTTKNNSNKINTKHVVLLVKKWLLIPNKLALFDLEGKLNYRTREDKLEGWVILKCLFWKISFHGQISVYML